MVNAIDLARRPQDRVLGRPQRVRERREQPAAHPRRAHRVERVPLAQLRQVDDRLALRHRARPGAGAARVLREVLPARQRGAGRLRQVRRRGRARLGREDVRRAAASRARSLAPTYTVEPVQDGERRVELRRNGDVSVVGLAYHTLAGSSPDFAAVDAALDILTREPSGRLYKKLVETKLAASLYGWTQPTPRPEPVAARTRRSATPRTSTRSSRS